MSSGDEDKTMSYSSLSSNVKTELPSGGVQELQPKSLCKYNE